MNAPFGEVIEKLRRSTVAVKTRRGGGGSGVIWAPEGSIVTNAHVVQESSGGVEVELWDGRRLPAVIAHRDRRRDLAVLRVEAMDFPAISEGDSDALRAGELVIAVGNPLGFIGAASTGVVHGFVVHDFNDRSWVVSQLRLAPGNSGGPLANARGEVVGINTMIAGGLAFAVPSRRVARFLNQNAEPAFGLGVLVGARGKSFEAVQDLEIAIRASRGGVLELHFRRAANSNIRTVAVSLAHVSKRAA